MWVFGYGSLIWKVDFPYEKKLVGYIKGFKRRFWQRSEDHRGVPGKFVVYSGGGAHLVGRLDLQLPRHLQQQQQYMEKNLPAFPGRVVTLIPSEDVEEPVWGIAYKLSKANVQQVTKYLDYREKDGYQKVCTMFYPLETDFKAFELMVYIGSESNPFYVGPADIDAIALQISAAEGPSGRNSEYVFQLAEAMRALAPNAPDPHLFSVEAAVRKLVHDEMQNL